MFSIRTEGSRIAFHESIMQKIVSRTQRMAHTIQKEIATILHLQVRDPRIGSVSVSAVELSRDHAVAKIFIIFSRDDNSQRVLQGLQGLKEASGFIRLRLSRALSLRIVPTLHFFHDTSLLQGNKISHLLTQALCTKQTEIG